MKHKAAIVVVVLLLGAGGVYLYRRKPGRNDGFDRLIDPYKNYDPGAVNKGCVYVEKVVNQRTGETVSGDRWYCNSDPVASLPGFR